MQGEGSDKALDALFNEGAGPPRAITPQEPTDAEVERMAQDLSPTQRAFLAEFIVSVATALGDWDDEFYVEGEPIKTELLDGEYRDLMRLGVLDEDNDCSWITPLGRRVAEALEQEPGR